jgi:cytochrome bd-type quinol oxidase subunit 2
MGAAFVPGVQYLQYLVMLVGLILNAIAFSKANEGFVTFGNVFGSCFKATLIVTLILVAWSVASGFAFPEMKEKALEMAREKMAKNSKVTDEQMEMSMNMMRNHWNTIIVAGSLFSTLFAGALFSLIGGAIAKKHGERPFNV